MVKDGGRSTPQRIAPAIETGLWQRRLLVVAAAPPKESPLRLKLARPDRSGPAC